MSDELRIGEPTSLDDFIGVIARFGCPTELVVDADCPPDTMYLRSAPLTTIAEIADGPRFTLTVGSEERADEAREAAKRIGVDLG
jgi:hypothetical protein